MDHVNARMEDSLSLERVNAQAGNIIQEVHVRLMHLEEFRINLLSESHTPTALLIVQRVKLKILLPVNVYK
jgi:hypothetical protein